MARSIIRWTILTAAGLALAGCSLAPEGQLPKEPPFYLA